LARSGPSNGRGGSWRDSARHIGLARCGGGSGPSKGHGSAGQDLAGHNGTAWGAGSGQGSARHSGRGAVGLDSDCRIGTAGPGLVRHVKEERIGSARHSDTKWAVEVCQTGAERTDRDRLVPMDREKEVGLQGLSLPTLSLRYFDPAHLLVEEPIRDGSALNVTEASVAYKELEFLRIEV